MKSKTQSEKKGTRQAILFPRNTAITKIRKATIVDNRALTELKCTEEALHESEERYRTILEDIDESYFENDLTGNFIFVNDVLCRDLGYTRKELIGMNYRQYMDEVMAKLSYDIFSKIYKTGKSSGRYEGEFIEKDGTKHFSEVSVSLMRDPQGKPIGFRGLSRNISKRKKMENAIRQSEEKYRNIIETIVDGYVEIDFAGNWTFVNDVICEHMKYSREELTGMDFHKLHTARSAERSLKAFGEVHQTGKPLRSLEVEGVRKDGTIGNYELSVSLMKDAKGQPIGFHCISRDITERKQMEESLRKSEEKYRTIVENSQEGIFQSSPYIHHLTFNRAFAAMLGYTCPEEAEKNITSIAGQIYVNPDEYKKVRDIIRREGGIKGYETEFYRKDKSRIWVNMSVSEVRNSQGRLLYYHGIVEDITPKKKLERERQDNIDRLRKSLGATIKAMSATVEARDPYTAGHQRRVADLARSIATEMKLSRDQIDGIRMAGMIHDLGKISVPSEILTKPTQLSKLERELIRTHPEAGYNILKDIEFPWPIARIVLEHHERIDGSGYPYGLKGDDILLESKIIAIADVAEAISSNRPYRPAFGIGPALDEIAKNSGTLYDATAAEACLKLFRENCYKMPE